MKTVRSLSGEFKRLAKAYCVLDPGSPRAMRAGRSWFRDDWTKVYGGVYRRWVDQQWRICAVVASVETMDEHRGQGAFKTLLDALEKGALWDMVYVESICNDRLWDSLCGRGYVCDPDDCCSLVKLVTRKK